MTNHFEIISETPCGIVSYCDASKQYQLAYKNMIVMISSAEQYKKTNSFFQNMQKNCCGRRSHLNKKYVFGINGTTTFFAFDDAEMNELKELLARACFKIQIQELLNNN
jgi:hypothetical protein